MVLRLTGIRKHYKGAAAVEHVDLTVGRGEFFTLLGPSGSGKTTTLRLIAGFERPDAGIIELDGVDVARTPPFDRNINTVFQDYALFPHMSVADNVAYGLKAKGVRGDACRARVAEALRTVQMTAFGERLPAQLSGGQRQRVGLARAIVNRPGLLLLDEPLGALDLKLRHDMQLELKHIQKEVGITFLYVTHDQEEALSMSSRIAIFNKGRIEQIGTPREIYDRPVSAFVAGFVGTSSLVRRDSSVLVLRPEKVRVAPPGTAMPAGFHVEPGRLEDEIYLGMMTKLVIRLADGTAIEALRPNDGDPADLVSGSPVAVGWDPSTLRVLDETR
ncbi:ABC transporter ATP-binding protein [Hyphomicrobiales bacterium BP6-180914]|uniref:ABC transporter ATP-binding protein n=1 Tax=Lichenifustis flavocetrariae TaxID=2949735 RepID=A0AA42CHT0_9HYPH|nr:ABC transporter ATP-binding protein [Lichenifustis flavocetrariae]MCW6507594.1 ABC transporter ATP-binding protein [Lichenifustis flavocetrariae]